MVNSKEGLSDVFMEQARVIVAGGGKVLESVGIGSVKAIGEDQGWEGCISVIQGCVDRARAEEKSSVCQEDRGEWRQGGTVQSHPMR